MSEEQKVQLESFKTFDEYAEAFSFRDSAKMYSSGVQLISVANVKRYLEAKGYEVPAEEIEGFTR